MDAKKPRLSWKLKSDKRNVLQEAYHIKAAYDEKMTDIIWDSGIVESEDSQRVPAMIHNLKSKDIIYWNVEIKAGGEIAASETAHFEMGNSCCL